MGVARAAGQQPDTGRILIVDDDDQIRRMLGAALAMRGYDVAMAPDAYEGLQRYRESPADLVMLDYIIPRNGNVPYLSSTEMIAALYEINPSVAIYVMSGHDARDVSMAGLGGIAGFVEKPFDLCGLCARIDSALKK